MAELFGRKGVWFVYQRGNEGYEAVVIAGSSGAAARYAAQNGEAYMNVGFWPYGMTLNEAIDWFKND